MKIKTQLNYHLQPQRAGMALTMPSKTVPDQSLSLKQILSRYSRGQSLPSSGKAVFLEDDADLSKFKSLDMVEQQEIIEARRERLNQLKLQYDQDQRKARESEQNERKTILDQISELQKVLLEKKESPNSN